jgi:hypothetical protein
MKSNKPIANGSNSNKSKDTSHPSTFEQSIKPQTNPTQPSIMLTTSQSIFSKDDSGESVRVAVRVRPLMQFELARGDLNCISVPDSTHCHIQIKYIATIEARPRAISSMLFLTNPKHNPTHLICADYQ